MKKLNGKTALITGGARSIGEATAREFARLGAKVVLADVLVTEGEKVVEEICAQGGDAIFFRLDVTSEAAWKEAVAQTISSYGKLDILINNAGIVSEPASIEERSAEEWDRVMAINAKGVFLGVKHAIPAMRQVGGGSIVNISSMRALGQFRSTDAAYAASKAAVRVFTKVVAGQCAPDNIRCNSIHPGPIDTAMLRAAFPDTESMQQRMSRVPMGRPGQLSEIVAGILYFASDDASFTTGAELAIDGGSLVD